MKVPYSHDYMPPAPVLIVSLAAPEQAPQVSQQPALIDTGADGTFVPTALLEYLQVPVIYVTNVRSHLGQGVRRVSVHRVDILLDSVRVPGIEVVGDDWGDEIILGRNALNKLQLFLDGPHQITRLE